MSYPVSSLIQVSDLDLAQLNRKFDLANPGRILAWCVENLPTGLVQASAFNVDDMVLTDILYRALRPVKPVPVLFLDTLHHFPETLDLVAQAKALYRLNLKVYRIQCLRSAEAFAAKYGEAFWKQDIEKFHYLTKIEPLQRGLSDLGSVAWITGRRRDQSPTRSEMPVFEWDHQGRLKVNPLANWKRKESWAYVFEHDVIYNPLHDHGYSSIGDEPLTTPIREGEDERAGRWRGTNKTECGIHI
ncbi:phosphoadenosine phosphosulfate reductase [Leptolyngbya sp. 'hensonii']|uniref:phosphoadenosine phosphosulfate reductase n=1 Tax=Leptolyngbya sp. 'hensonii' TaxID=1922337 RepID=UPI0009501915|nr:phosphoadenosine phosphosulfate reductase [Leptolyngbya sp. 'hensonii']OLP18589.1 phosphoadenosine phosphosulfate reductase [Leptolyngbya sp. 'hensonii']